MMTEYDNDVDDNESDYRDVSDGDDDGDGGDDDGDNLAGRSGGRADGSDERVGHNIRQLLKNQSVCIDVM